MYPFPPKCAIISLVSIEFLGEDGTSVLVYTVPCCQETIGNGVLLGKLGMAISPEAIIGWLFLSGIFVLYSTLYKVTPLVGLGKLICIGVVSNAFNSVVNISSK